MLRPALSLALVALLLLPACGGGGGGMTPTPPTPPTPPSPVTIYQVDADSGPGIVGIYGPDDGTLDGDIAPDNTIGGPTNSGFNSAFGVHVDSRANTLIVGDTSTPAILFFDGVQALSGDESPTRALGGASSLITATNAYETFVDETRDLLYVAYNNGVFVYANAGTINGDVAPVRNITGGTTGLGSNNRDKRLFVDETNDRLYVLDGDTATLLVWDNASTVDGDTAPSRTVTSASFSFPWGLAVDVARDIVYVADESNSAIYVFDGAAALNGSVAPNRTIAGATSAVENPAGIDLDAELDRLYVTNFAGGTTAAISIWHDASTADGDVAPNRSIGGAATSIDSTADVHVSR